MLAYPPLAATQQSSTGKRSTSSRTRPSLSQPASPQTERLRAHIERSGGVLSTAARAQLAKTVEGCRNATLLSLVARLAQAGWGGDDIRGLVLPATDAIAAAGGCWAGYDVRREVDKLVAWVTARDQARAAALTQGGPAAVMVQRRVAPAAVGSAAR